MSLLNHYVIALYATSFTLTALGLFVYFKNPKNKINWTFTLYCLVTALWSGGTAYAIDAPNKATAVLWTHLFHSGVVFITPCFVHFTFSLLEIKGKKQRVIQVVYIFAFIFLICNYTKLLLADVVTPKMSLKYYFEPGTMYPFFLLFWGGCAIYGLFELFRALIHSSGARRNQLKYLCWGTLIGYVGGVSNYLPAFDIEIYPYNPFATYGVVIYVFMMTYAIVRYRLMDINVVFGKLATYSVLLSIIGSVCLGLMIGIDKIFYRTRGYNPLLSHFFIFLVISIALIYFIPHIKIKTEEKIERTFFKNSHSYREALREFSKKIILIPQEEQILTETVKNIADEMKVSTVAIILMDELSGNYVVRAQRGLSLSQKNNEQVFSSDDKIIKWLTENKKALLVEEMDKILPAEDTEKIKVELQDIGAIIYLPLIVQERLIGVLALGEKVSREMFSHLDIDLLESLSLQLASAMSYKRLEAQMVRINRLVSLGTLAAGMAHEIRNPLSSIQTFAQLLPEKYNDQEFREEFSKIVVSDTQRISRLIESVMALANPRPSVLLPCDVNELLNETIFLIESRIKKEGVEVTRNYDKQLPRIKLDKEQIEQVFLNIFLNALDAFSRIDGRLIKVSTHLKSIPSIFPYREGKYVQIEIEDNGVGIEEKFLDRIFEPFFTTRPQGTGLGLAIVHKIIEQHRGFIKVYSTVGKGTTFLINLPLEEKDV